MKNAQLHYRRFIFSENSYQRHFLVRSDTFQTTFNFQLHPMHTLYQHAACREGSWPYFGAYCPNFHPSCGDFAKKRIARGYFLPADENTCGTEARRGVTQFESCTPAGEHAMMYTSARAPVVCNFTTSGVRLPLWENIPGSLWRSSSH